MAPFGARHEKDLRSENVSSLSYLFGEDLLRLALDIYGVNLVQHPETHTESRVLGCGILQPKAAN